MTLDEFEQNFTVYPVQGDKHLAPTSEPYVTVEILIDNFGASESIALNTLLDAVAAYARGKAGTLYWRTKPELRRIPRRRAWSGYARLLVSDKPVGGDQAARHADLNCRGGIRFP